MQIKQAALFATAYNKKQLPETGRPEIAMVGRSNVGKSSLINRMTNRKGLARTSSVPGKTRSINFFLINDVWMLVDLPGYGFAKASKTDRAGWGRLIEDYLISRQELAGLVHLIDIRHDPMQSDIEMQEWLRFHGISTLIVATKSDKLSKSKRIAAVKRIKEVLKTDNQVIACSAESGEGIEEVLKALDRWTKPENKNEE